MTHQEELQKAALDYQCESHPGKEYFNRGELQHCFHAAWNLSQKFATEELTELVAARADAAKEIEALRLRVSGLLRELNATIGCLAQEKENHCTSVKRETAEREMSRKLAEALWKIGSCEPIIKGDCPSIAREALAEYRAAREGK